MFVDVRLPFNKAETRNYALAVAGATVLALGAVISKEAGSEVLNPDREARVISRISSFPDQYRLMLKQCGFDSSWQGSGEADAQGCVTEEYNVTQESFVQHPTGSEVKPGNLEQP